MKWFLTLALVGPLAAQCTYTPSVAAITSIPANGATGNIVIATQTGCSWTYTSDSSWLTFVGGQTSGQGTSGAVVSWLIGTNLLPTARTGNIVITGTDAGATPLNIPLTQVGSSCTLTLPSAAGEVAVGVGSYSFGVQSNCVWNSYSNTNWIAVTAGASGGGPGTVTYTTQANPCVAGRTGSVVAEAGSTTPVTNLTGYPYPVLQYAVNQDGSAANLTIAPTSVAVPVAGGIGRIAITTADGCNWAAYSDVNWVGFTTSNAGTGSGGLTYSVLANPGLGRTGHIYFGSLAFAVTQAAAVPVLPQVTGVANSASWTSGAVSPGEIVAIFGTAMGPSAPGVGEELAADGQSITTSLGGTTVLFDGVAAALTYVSAGQVNAIVPYEVAGKINTQLTVEAPNGSSLPLALNVQAATPGIYTLDFSGAGGGAILNQDNTINSGGRPAAIGSAVQIYMTGGGVTNPPTVDASITPLTQPFPVLVTQPVTVTIGGLPAQVLYYGGSPGEVAGLTQINAVVPAGAPVGPSVPVVVQIGTWQSQAGVTLAVSAQ